MKKVLEHGCPDPQECEHCAPILYEIGLDGIKEGLVPEPAAITSKGIENMAEHITPEDLIPPPQKA